MEAEYYCPKCGLVVGADHFAKNRFCMRDGTHMLPRISHRPFHRAEEIKQVTLARDDINVHTLYREFLNLPRFTPGEGMVFDSTRDWLAERARAYERFRKEFTPSNLADLQNLQSSFSDFLHFKHNLSWTTLYRTGTEALQYPERLRNLLLFLQDESVDVAMRVGEALEGNSHVPDVGRNISTAIIHICDTDDRYGIWNTRTVDTLDMLRRKPKFGAGPGLAYVRINKELNSLKAELSTNLLVVDSFMWYVSKKVKVAPWSNLSPSSNVSTQ